MKGICAIERDAQTQGEISFEESGVVADEVCAVLIQDTGFDPFEKKWTFE